MPKLRPPGLDYVLRTPHGRAEYKGTHVQGLELLFVSLPDALARRKMLDQLEKKHRKLLEDESGPDVEQATAAQVASLASQVHPSSALPSLTPEGHAARLASQPLTRCAAALDGNCVHPRCPQLRDGEPLNSGRHCPLDHAHEDDAK